MQELFSSISTETVLQWLRAGATLIVGLLVARLIATGVYRLTHSAMGISTAATLRRVVFYLGALLVAVGVLHQLGLDLGVLLGAAGILSVAIGFASQTSASNLVSGIFLVAERPFGIGDVIRVGTTTGEVLSIDLLSVKLRTFDNLYVRVPNESLIKSEITNLTRFPIRRLDLKIGIAYKEDIGKVRDILTEVADGYPLCLDQPRPLVIFLGFGESSLDLQFSVWARSEDFLEMRNILPEAIKRGFDDAGIEIPFPHRSLYAGSETEPFPVRVVDATNPAEC